jgi:hypothetical protein
MIILMAMLTVAAIIVGTGFMLGLRTWVLDEGKTEKRLRAPETHTLDYAVPHGQDPALLKAALAGAHFSSITRTGGSSEHLTIACEEQDRARVRDVLEHVHAASAAGRDEHVGHIRFSDEV